MDSTSSTDRTQRNSESDTHPLWNYVTKLEKLGDKGGNQRWQCSFCNKQFSGSYSRVKAHLLRIPGVGVAVCSKVDASLKARLQREVEEIERRSNFTTVPLPPNSSSSQGSSMAFASLRVGGLDTTKKRKSSPLEQAFNNEARDQLRSEIARMFYASGLPFHLSRSPFYVSAFSYAANNNIPGFVPPGYNALRTTLLQKERANIERLLEPIKGTWKEKGVSIVSDGWTDAQRRPIINFMAVADSQPMFLRAVNCEGEYKDKNFIANLLKEVILEVGAKNVVQVVTDNAPVCKSAGMLVEAQFEHIFWTPCVVHTLNLALKNICAPTDSERNEEAHEAHEALSWITDVASEVVQIRNFINNHSMRLAMFNEFVNLKLLSVAETRFASVVVMLKRFKLVKGGLQTMVISDRWSNYREDDPRKAQFVKEKILNDLWWDKIDYILAFTAPIYDMLRFADTDKPALHLIYDMWDSMIEKVKQAIFHKECLADHEESSFYDIVHKILVDRWNKSSRPLHCLAHSLNPRYYSEEWLREAPNRLAPHRDGEISEERNKCLKRYFPDPVERRVVINEFTKFSGASDAFSSFDCLSDRAHLDAKGWWLFYGTSTPNLQSLALKLLAQPCSSSCAERNWSTYSFIHSLRRNKILPQRAEDLVFVHSNLRLLSRKNEQYMQGDSKMWDVGGDVFDPLDGAGELEIAQLSLDEPDMEAVLFEEIGGDDNDTIQLG